MQTLSLSNGVAIESLDATISLDDSQMLQARSGSGETFEQAVQRITGEFADNGYVPGL